MISEQIKELQELEKHEIDYSDIPQTTDFSNARFKYYELKPRKEVVTLRLDADLVSVLRSLGKGYQTKINETLRKIYM